MGTAQSSVPPSQNLTFEIPAGRLRDEHLLFPTVPEVQHLLPPPALAAAESALPAEISISKPYLQLRLPLFCKYLLKQTFFYQEFVILTR